MMYMAELLFPQPSPLWRLVKQCGVNHAVGVLAYPQIGNQFSWESNHGTTLAAVSDAEQPWQTSALLRVKQRYAEAGFTLAVVESSPPMERLRRGLPGRDEEIANICSMLEAMGTLGIPVWCYNWMPQINWSRTSVATPTRGGALTSSFDRALAPVAETPSELTEDVLWANLRYFLERVLPTAEAAGVKLAMHPDDPPLSPFAGMGRIMSSVENFQRLIDLVPSPSNGITLCQGNFVLLTDDLPGLIRHFGEQGKIFFVHMRDTRGTPERFEETFHDDGPTDMLACMQAYQAIGYDGVLRPDHVPTMEGEANTNPGYETLGRLFALGYLRGLHEAVYGKARAIG